MIALFFAGRGCEVKGIDWSRGRKGQGEYQGRKSEMFSPRDGATNDRRLNKHNDHEVACALARSMGSQFRPAAGPWAGDYVAEWRRVSSNASVILVMVIDEMDKAYQIGLDITSEKVIGKMFDLAVQVWSELGAYTGYSQDEGRR